LPEGTGGVSYVTVARLVRARGNQGELAAALEADDPQIFEQFPEVYVWDGQARREILRVSRAWPHKDRLILKFAGIDTIDQAERLAGWQVQIAMSERPAAPEGRYYIAELIGCRVVEARSGRLLGEITGLLETGGAPVLEVRNSDRELLIPFASSICPEIDTAHGIVRVELPEGLEELNN